MVERAGPSQPGSPRWTRRWTFIGDELITYTYAADRSGETPRRILADTTGKLLVDGHTGYNSVTDVDGRDYLDFVGSWGPLILGHAHPQVITAVQNAAADGLSFGAPTQRETALARVRAIETAAATRRHGPGPGPAARKSARGWRRRPC